MRKPARKETIENSLVEPAATTGSVADVVALERELNAEIDRLDPSLPLEARLKPLFDRIDAFREDARKRGLVGTDDFDMKAFTDEGWGEI